MSVVNSSESRAMPHKEGRVQMQMIEQFEKLRVEATSWRRHLHEHPELDYRLTEIFRRSEMPDD